ncbi:hypothetical protein IL306_007358 [Fusarium sp. DS 682]|nr:hypothetical protein IL306_007358 [Fusarium sp. DS 682]
MNKCWFVLEQSFFHPPVYANASKAGGKAEGDLRLGDVVHSPKDLYPILTKGPLPLFTPDMRISSSQLCGFAWDNTYERGGDGAVGGGLPIVNAVGATVQTEVKIEFKKTVRNWVNFETMDIEVVQPSAGYINAVLKTESLKDYIDQKKIPFLDRWTVYVVTGLMIGRARGTVGNLNSRSHSTSGGPEVDIPGVASEKLNAGIKSSNEISKSAEVQGHRIWSRQLSRRWFENYNQLREILQPEEGETGPGYRRIKIAVLDTGIYPEDYEYYCEVGTMEDYKDYVGTALGGATKDETGHGSAAVALLVKTCPNACLYLARVLKTNNPTHSEIDNVAAAIDWATNHEIDLVTLALGFKDYQPKIANAIARARAKQILIFSAASNSQNMARIYFPAKDHRQVFGIFCTNAGNQMTGKTSDGKYKCIRPWDLLKSQCHDRKEQRKWVLGTIERLLDKV